MATIYIGFTIQTDDASYDAERTGISNAIGTYIATLAVGDDVYFSNVLAAIEVTYPGFSSHVVTSKNYIEGEGGNFEVTSDPIVMGPTEQASWVDTFSIACSNYYVDFATGTPLGIGTTGSPYAYGQFFIDPPGVNELKIDDITYFIKSRSTVSGSSRLAKDPGVIRYPDDVLVPNTIIIKAWDLDLYGPWGMSHPGGFTIKCNSGSLSDGILMSTSGNPILYCHDTHNMAIVSSTANLTQVLSWDGIEQPLVNGCFIKGKTLDGFTQGINPIWKDCIFNFAVAMNFHTFINCCFNMADWGDGPDPLDPGSKTNCQFSWTPVAWPAITAAKELYDETILLAGVTTPPSPGNSPYTNYNKNLWGGQRDNIGAYYDSNPMPPTTTTTGAPTTTTVAPTTTLAPTTTTEAPPVPEDRFWVSSTQNAFNSSYWSTYSGGPSGASVPSSLHSVIFDNNGLGDCTFNIAVNILSLKEDSGYTGKLFQTTESITTGDASFLGGTFIGTGPLIINQNLILSEGFSWQGSDSTFSALGDVYCNAGFINENNCVLSFIGSNDQKLYCNGGILPILYIDKTASNQIKTFGNYPIYINGDLTLHDGTFNTNGHDIIVQST